MFKKSKAMTLPPHRQYDFRVDLIPGATPQASKIIPLSPAEETALNSMINEGLSKGTIRQTTSPWAAPVLFTGKKDGNLRPCFDYRKLNALTVKNKYPLPLTMELVDSLRDAENYTSLDLRNGYNNLRVKEGEEQKLAFICKRGQFEPLVMPFGPTGAPGFFQFFISDILREKIGRELAAYLDDLLIYTPEGVDHEKVVEEVLQILQSHSIWLKPEKCKFSKKEIEYLGLLISKNKVRMDPLKVSAVSDWPIPRNVNQIQRFLGFSNFYRRFISNFSKITRPLHDLTKDDTPFVWTGAQQQAFDTLKTSFTTAPILKIANPYKPFILECDCSDFALGAVLSQLDDTEVLHPVAFLSRSLVQAERNYKIFDKELLAVVASFKEWRHYLEGNPNRLEVTVYTDHKNLETFMTTKQLTRRQARWAETFGCFDFHIRFRPGRQSTKPDALSRRPDLEPSAGKKLSFGSLLRPENLSEASFNVDIDSVEGCFVDESIEHEDVEEWFEQDVCQDRTQEAIEIDAMDAKKDSPILTDDEIMVQIREKSKSDPRIQGLMDTLRSLTIPEVEEALQGYEVRDGVLYHKGIVEVPDDKACKFEILRSRHTSVLTGHPGRAKTLSLVQRQYKWKSMKTYVNNFVDGCDSCIRVKPSSQSPFGSLEPLPIPAGP